MITGALIAIIFYSLFIIILHWRDAGPYNQEATKVLRNYTFVLVASIGALIGGFVL